MGSGYPVASGAVDVDPASGTVYSHSHKFEKHNYTTPTSCDVCHSLLWGPRTGLRCIDCGFNVHEKCRDKAPKSCTRFKASAIPKDDTTENFEQFQRDDATPKLRVTNSDNEDMYYGQFARNIDENSQIIYQGYLFKQVNIFSSKWSKWFVSLLVNNRRIFTRKNLYFKIDKLLSDVGKILNELIFFQANFKIKGWKQRWFVLDSTKHQMRYYDTREDFHCKGEIDLSEVTRITEGNNTTPGAPRKSEDKCFFELQTLKRNYCFCAETRQAAHEWVSKIQMCLQ